MRMFARPTLAAGAAAIGGPALVLEGSWPVDGVGAAENVGGAVATVGDDHGRRCPPSEGPWSLDEMIDARRAWIDQAAAELAAEVAENPHETSLAYLNELALRYFLVKLLRVVAFFEIHPPAPGDRLAARLVCGKDAAYDELLREIAQHYGASLEVEWCAAAPARHVHRRPIPWRRWAARAQREAAMRTPPSGLPADSHLADGAPRVVLCGNPRILDAVCGELIARQANVWWLHEQFAARCWWRWRRQGVGQLTCDSASRSARFDDVAISRDIRCRGIRLNGALDCWLGERVGAYGPRQSRWIEVIERHFRAIHPTAIVLDEDATPLKRAVVALARRHAAPSMVVQHGAPCGRFGFSPLAADKIGVWGDATRAQLRAWNVPDEQIAVVGWPCFDARLLARRPASASRRRRGPRFLLLATVPPSDSRPDTVEFHLTRCNHEAMLDMVCTVISETEDARLTLKLHPRAADGAVFARVLARWPRLRAKIVHHTSLSAVLPSADCVLSCASTAGIESALAGAPVVQLLPAGSADVLPADQWGLIGSARTAPELRSQIVAALERGWIEPPAEASGVAAAIGRTAAARIVAEVCRGGRAVASCAEAHTAAELSLVNNL